LVISTYHPTLSNYSTLPSSSPASTFHSLGPESAEPSNSNLTLQPSDVAGHEEWKGASGTGSGSVRNSFESRSQTPQSGIGEDNFYGNQFQVERHYRSDGKGENEGLDNELGGHPHSASTTPRDDSNQFVNDPHPLQSQEYPRPMYRQDPQSSRPTSPSTTPTWERNPSPNASQQKLKSGWLSPSSPTPSVSATTIPMSPEGQGPSLSAHYLPTKFSSSLNSYASLDPRRSNTPARGISSSSSSFKITSSKSPLSLSKAIDSTPKARNRFNNRESNESSSEDFRRSQIGSPSKPPLSSSSRIVKRGAGRDAWGPDAGGEAVLGAGGYEDDDGVDLDWQREDQGNDGDGIIGPQVQGLRRRKSKKNRNGYPENGGDQSPTGRNVLLDTRREKGGGRIGSLFSRGSFGNSGNRRKLRWNRFKWVLFFGNLVVSFLGS